MKTGAQRVIGYEIAIDGEGCGQGVVTGDRRRSGQTIRGKAARLLRQKTRRVTKVPPLDQWLQDPTRGTFWLLDDPTGAVVEVRAIEIRPLSMVGEEE